MPSICRGWTVTPTPVLGLFPELSSRSYRPNAPFAELVSAIQEHLADEMREDYTRPILGE